MSASPLDPLSPSTNRDIDSPFEATEHYFTEDKNGVDDTTNGHHHPGPSAPAWADTRGDPVNTTAQTKTEASAVLSASAQAAAPQPSDRRSGFWTLVALAVGITATWFLFSELTTAASMQGSTVGNLIQLRAEVAGIVDEITTSESSDVIVGQTVARLGASGIETQLQRIEEVLALKRLEADQVQRSIDEEKLRLQLLHEISQRTETTLSLGIDELKIRLELATHLATELQGSVNRGSAKKFEFLEAESNRLRIAKQLEESLAELDLQKLITTNAAQGRHYHNGVVRSWLDELQLHAAKVATEIGQTEVEAATLRITVDQSSVATHRAGRVFAIHHPPGSSVQPGDPIITLETDDRVWIIASFKYSEAEDIAYGDRAVIDFPALGQSITGSVVAIGHNVISAIDADSPFLRLTPEEVLVKIEPDSAVEELRSGISAKVHIRTHSFDPIGWITKKIGRGTSANNQEKTTPEPPPAKKNPTPTQSIPAPDSGDEIPPMQNPFDFSQR